jgi:hypothetical protein
MAEPVFQGRTQKRSYRRDRRGRREKHLFFCFLCALSVLCGGWLNRYSRAVLKKEVTAEIAETAEKNTCSPVFSALSASSAVDS